ncbi:MAG: adenylyl-sulfate kinase, partial [Gemmatimonadetes bacterium]|nr:adenylyl-sulfate kinase [Gemmatimonadota bacterium]
DGQDGQGGRGGPGGQGVTVLLTGLPGSGKSTVARALVARLKESGVRGVSLIDGDLIRRTISADLGFSKEDREEHIRRVTRMAAEITRRGGVAVCALIAPFEAIRAEFRRAIEVVGRFVLVYVATPVDVCEARDRKGSYARARAGAIPQFTGVSDPYEVPRDAEVTIGGEGGPAAAAAGILRDHFLSLARSVPHPGRER